MEDSLAEVDLRLDERYSLTEKNSNGERVSKSD